MHTHPLSLVVVHLQPLFIHLSSYKSSFFTFFNSFLIRTKKIEIEINRKRQNCHDANGRRVGRGNGDLNH